jgi:hypothetical protein
MNPKEKANQIFDKMYENQQTSVIGGNHSQYGNARRCCLFLVDEILNLDLRSSPYDSVKPYDYWKEVRLELERL